MTKSAIFNKTGNKKFGACVSDKPFSCTHILLFSYKRQNCLIMFDLDERVRESIQNKKNLVRHLGFNRKLNNVETKSTWFVFLHYF